MLHNRLLFTAAVTVVAALAATAGVYAWRVLNPPPPPTLPAESSTGSALSAVAVGDRRPDLRLRDLDGTLRSMSEWDGRVLVVNFWATWCPPCLEEIPLLVALQEKYRARGLTVLGIALDSPQRAAQFMQSNGVTYETLHGEQDAIDASKAFGNTYGSLPFTATVGRDGRIVDLHSGIVTEAGMERLIVDNL
jgi:thiol-disulfide isomerase/thioredoxin